MKKFLLFLFLILIVAVAVIAGMAATRPDDFSVTRSATITAPPDAVFAQVNNLHKWEAWSPWAKLDPAAKTTYDGPAAGVGAGFGWAGNMQIGEGHMAITDSKANETVQFKLDFVKPFKGTNDAVFTFKPESAGTSVTWTMSGKKNFVAKVMGLFINCDKMIGGQFEKGLAQLKSVSETPAAKPAL